MQDRWYLVETPDQLRVLNRLCEEGSTLYMAVLWEAQRQKHGKSDLDGHVYVRIYVDGYNRHAILTRSIEENPVVDAKLRYNLALQFCRENLKRI